MNSTTKSFLVSAIRRASMRWKQKNIAKNLRKVGPATYRCDLCGFYVYEGAKSLQNHLLVMSVHPSQKIIKGKFEMDHKLRCVPIEGFTDGIWIDGKKKSYWWNWGIYLTRMFCEVDDYQGLCQLCHGDKTAEEKQSVPKKPKRKKKNE